MSLFNRYFANSFGDNDVFQDPFFNTPIRKQQHQTTTTQQLSTQQHEQQHPTTQQPSSRVSTPKRNTTSPLANTNQLPPTTPPRTTREVDNNNPKQSRSRRPSKQSDPVDRHSLMDYDHDFPSHHNALALLANDSLLWNPHRRFNDLFNAMNHDMDDMLDQFNHQQERLSSLPDDGNNHYASYSYSSHRSTLPDADGVLRTRTSNTSSSNVNGVLEEKSSTKDSYGNERLSHKKMIGDKGFESIQDKSHEGKTRLTNNFTNLNSNDMETFDKEFHEKQNQIHDGWATYRNQKQLSSDNGPQPRLK